MHTETLNQQRGRHAWLRGLAATSALVAGCAVAPPGGYNGGGMAPMAPQQPVAVWPPPAANPPAGAKPGPAGQGRNDPLQPNGAQTRPGGAGGGTTAGAGNTGTSGTPGTQQPSTPTKQSSGGDPQTPASPTGKVPGGSPGKTVDCVKNSKDCAGMTMPVIVTEGAGPPQKPVDAGKSALGKLKLGNQKAQIGVATQSPAAAAAPKAAGTAAAATAAKALAKPDAKTPAIKLQQTGPGN